MANRTEEQPRPPVNASSEAAPAVAIPGWTPAETKELLREAVAGTGKPDMPPEPAESDTDDDPLAGPYFGAPFLEKFLIAVIDAHSVDKLTRRQRLDLAMRALTGRKSSKRPLAGEKDEAALLWMAKKRRNTREQATWAHTKGNPPEAQENLSDLELATAAAKLFYGDDHLTHTHVGRLREKFSGTYEIKQERKKARRADPTSPTPPDQHIDRRLTLEFQAVENDFVVESIHWEALNGLKAIFESLNIPMKVERR